MPPGTPIHSPTPRSTSPVRARPRVLHIGDPVKYNLDTYAAFVSQCDIVRPSAADRERDAFAAGLREGRWGNFDAIFRPFWGTGGEMGRWDAELIELLPQSVKVFASAGAGFDWADTKLLGERGESGPYLFLALRVGEATRLTGGSKASSTATRASRRPRPWPTLQSP